MFVFGSNLQSLVTILNVCISEQWLVLLWLKKVSIFLICISRLFLVLQTAKRRFLIFNSCLFNKNFVFRVREKIGAFAKIYDASFLLSALAVSILMRSSHTTNGATTTTRFSTLKCFGQNSKSGQMDPLSCGGPTLCLSIQYFILSQGTIDVWVM